MATYELEFEPSEKIALTVEEIKKLLELDLKRQVLEDVRNVFLLQCFTGLSYGDVKRLSKEHFTGISIPDQTKALLFQ